MLRYIARRVAGAVLLVLAVTLITFVIFDVVPEDPAFLILGPGAALYPDEAARVRHQLGVDRPLYVQYADYVWQVVRHGSLGQTYESVRAGRGETVRDLVDRAAPTTALLVAGGLVIWLLLSIPLGMLAAMRPRSRIDRLALAFGVVGISVHPLILGLTLQQLFGFRWQLLPYSGYCPLVGHGGLGGCGGPVEWASHLVLPWITFAMLFIALYSRMVRAAVPDVLGEQYVTVARAKGMSQWRLLRAHVLRNSMLPIVTMIGMDLGLAVGNAIYVERVFHLPGLGSLVYDSLIGAQGYELPVIAGVVLVVSVAVVMFNLLVDLAYGFVDPRVRVNARA